MWIGIFLYHSVHDNHRQANHQRHFCKPSYTMILKHIAEVYFMGFSAMGIPQAVLLPVAPLVEKEALAYWQHLDEY